MIRGHIKYVFWLLPWLLPHAARAQAWTFNHFAGAAVSGAGAYDGPGIDAKLNHPLGAAVDSTGNVYVADTTSVRYIWGQKAAKPIGIRVAEGLGVSTI